MRALFGESERDSPFVRSMRRVGGVNGKFSGKCQSILVMSNLFFARTTKFFPANRRCLLEIFDDPQSCQDLCMELAALVDAGVHFVNATYYLEGDGPLIFTCYERLSAVTRAVAVAREIAGGNAVLCNQLMAQAKACIHPGFQFYHQKFSVQFHGTVQYYNAKRV